MTEKLNKLLHGYQKFMEKYANSENSTIYDLYENGQNPEFMVISCCDSRVDPALLFQCDPGDLFVIRNIANIVPPYEKDMRHHGTSAALELGVKVLDVKHIIILGHSQCGGMQAWLSERRNCPQKKDLEFVDNWVSIIDLEHHENWSVDDCAMSSLINSYDNCLSFPWIKEKLENNELFIHLWFFDIKTGKIATYNHTKQKYEDLLPSSDFLTGEINHETKCAS